MIIIETKKKSAHYIMQKDENLLNNLKDEPILHFYEWETDSLTYGYFIDIEKYINIKKAEEKKLSYARRPTGGGIVFHLWDLAFSFLMPSKCDFFFENSLDNYKFVNNITLDAVKEFLSDGFLLERETAEQKLSFANFCMAKPTKYDLIYNNRKIAGASQRKKNKGYLHQASICLVPPDLTYLEDVIIEKEIAKKIFFTSQSLFSSMDIESNQKIIKENLIKSFKKQIS